MTDNPQLVMLRTVARAFGPLCPEVVFVGGAVTQLLVTSMAAARPRMTDDVDVVVAANSVADYYAFADRLRHQGFREDPNGPICRWRANDVKVDVMPTARDVLGFSNRWYDEALRTATTVRLDESTTVRVIAPCCFIATKLEAFASRGQLDPAASHDLEDIIAVIDGCDSVVLEASQIDSSDLTDYLATTLRGLLAMPAFEAIAAGHLGPDATSQGRLSTVLARLRALAAI